MKTVENKIQELIKASGFRQSFIAKKTGIGEVNLSYVMNNKRKLTSAEFLSLCFFLGVGIDDFKDVIKKEA